MSSRSIKKMTHRTEIPLPKVKDRVVAGKDGLSLVDVWKASLPDRRTLNRVECSTNNGECFDGKLVHSLKDILAIKDVSFKSIKQPPVYAPQAEGKTARSAWFVRSKETNESVG